MNSLFDLYFHEAQLEDRQTIVAKAKKDATKGGMLELCMKRYFSVAEPLLKELFQASSLDAPEQKVSRIGTLMGEITAAVVERGRGMTDDKVPEFSPRQHAILFGLMARSAIDSFGTEAADALLWQAVEHMAWKEAPGWRASAAAGTVTNRYGWVLRLRRMALGRRIP